MAKITQLTLARILEGKMAGRPQSVGIMDVVPLLPQDETHHNRMFAVPTKDMLLAGNPTYGTVVVANKDTSQPLIVPSNTTWITKHRAQDHAMSKAGLLGAGGMGTYDNAACVQSSQGGSIPADIYRFQILPATLRRVDKALAEEKKYSKLWDNISAMNRFLGVRTDMAHLEFLFTQFDKELSQFVAEFETIPRQIGALVIINGQLVGVEIAPSPAYWRSVWEPLIRFCYGPEALMAARQLGEEGVKSAVLSRPRLDNRNVASIEDLERALEDLRNAERSRTEQIVMKELEISLAFEVDDEIKVRSAGIGSTTYRLASSFEGFVGQVVVDEDYVVYASLVNKKSVPKRPARKGFRFLS
ncbi:ARPP-1 family domain-containing protein [Thermodesulfobacteriota bacterium]